MKVRKNMKGVKGVKSVKKNRKGNKKKTTKKLKGGFISKRKTRKYIIKKRKKRKTRRQYGGNNTLYLFDFDDTLMTTPALAKITYDKDIKCSISPADYNKLDEEIKNKIDDYSEFGSDDEKTIEQMKNGCKIKFTKDILDKNKSNDIGILTARSIKPNIMINFMSEEFEVVIKKENSVAINHKESFQTKIEELKTILPNESAYNFLDKLRGQKNKTDIDDLLSSKEIDIKKALAIIWFISKGYNKIHFYDDDENNIGIMEELNSFKISDDIVIKSTLVTPDKRKDCSQEIEGIIKDRPEYEDTKIQTEEEKNQAPNKCSTHIDEINEIARKKKNF